MRGFGWWLAVPDGKSHTRFLALDHDVGRRQKVPGTEMPVSCIPLSRSGTCTPLRSETFLQCSKLVDARSHSKKHFLLLIRKWKWKNLQRLHVWLNGRSVIWLDLQWLYRQELCGIFISLNQICLVAEVEEESSRSSDSPILASHMHSSLHKPNIRC
jgi:hypothetical protein